MHNSLLSRIHILLMNLLLDRHHGLFCQGLVLKQERQLLKRTAARLGVHEVDEKELEGNPSTVDGEVFPIDGFERNGVDIVGEETADLAEDLLDSDTAGTNGVGEEFDEVSLDMSAEFHSSVENQEYVL